MTELIDKARSAWDDAYRTIKRPGHHEKAEAFPFILAMVVMSVALSSIFLWGPIYLIWRWRNSNKEKA